MSRGRWIHGRVLTLALFGMLATVALMLWAGWSTTTELHRHVRSERELRATVTAERINRLLTFEQERLETLAAELRGGAQVNAALRSFLLHSHGLFEGAALLERGGSVAASEPAGWSATDGPLLASEALKAGRPLFTGLMGPEGQHRVYALVPIKTPEQVRVLAAAINPESKSLTSLLVTGDTPAPGAVDLIDARGVVVTSTDPARRFAFTDRANLFTGMIRDRRARSGDCHDCHLGTGTRVEEEYAFSPLRIASWGVAVREPHDVAHAFERTLGVRVALATFALMLMVVLFAWGAARSVTRPLEALTDSAVRLASGDLEVPLPRLPREEVGGLGMALEQMRTSLRDSMERVERTNAELEARVEDRTRELMRLNQELERREAQRADALRKVISAQEDERKRIARELHDETSQSLAALAIRLDTLGKRELSPEAREQLTGASALAVRTLDEVHRLCVFLRPSVLDDLGLASAIQWYADHALKPKGISVRCEFSGIDERLPPQMEIALFRCAQEAMTNIARHAEADTVLVQCSRRDGQLTLEIEDDGKGFVPQAVQVPDLKGRGLGLLGMRERVDLLGGELLMESEPGQGTHLTITIPMQEHEEEARHEQASGRPR